MCTIKCSAHDISYRKCHILSTPSTQALLSPFNNVYLVTFKAGLRKSVFDLTEDLMFHHLYQKFFIGYQDKYSFGIIFYESQMTFQIHKVVIPFL